jgi:PadR family transcriptional regulator AphA
MYDLTVLYPPPLRHLTEGSGCVMLFAQFLSILFLSNNPGNLMSPMTKSPLTIEYALLGVLRRKPMHGYELHRYLSSENALGAVWHIPQNKLYALLVRLEAEEYVTAQSEHNANRPTRKVFHVTRAGEQAFQHWVSRPVQRGRNVRLEFLVKLFLASEEETTTVSDLIDRQQQVCEAWLADEQVLLADTSQLQPYHRLVQQFRIGQIEAMINWLNQCRRSLVEKV